MMKKDGGMYNIKGKIYKLSGLVDYQDGSIVSKTIIDKKIGTVTLFAFDKGQGLSEHTVPYDALIYVADGVALTRIAGVENTVSAGEIIILPANKPHEVRAKERFKMMLVMIREVVE